LLPCSDLSEHLGVGLLLGILAGLGADLNVANSVEDTGVTGDRNESLLEVLLGGLVLLESGAAETTTVEGLALLGGREVVDVERASSERDGELVLADLEGSEGRVGQEREAASMSA
jgi:hypothetical protein